MFAGLQSVFSVFHDCRVTGYRAFRQPRRPERRRSLIGARRRLGRPFRWPELSVQIAANWCRFGSKVSMPTRHTNEENFCFRGVNRPQCLFSISCPIAVESSVCLRLAGQWTHIRMQQRCLLHPDFRDLRTKRRVQVDARWQPTPALRPQRFGADGHSPR
jgi:hypothetical protein